MAHLQPSAPRLRAVFFAANDEHSGRAWMLSLPRAGSGIVSLGNAKHGAMVPWCLFVLVYRTRTGLFSLGKCL